MSEEFNTTLNTTYTTSRVDQDCRCCRSGSGDTTTNMLKVVWGNDVSISIQLSKKVGDSYEEYDLSDGEDYKLNIVNKYGDRIEFPIFIADNKIKFILDSQELESNVPYSIEVLWQEGPYDKRVFGRDMFMYVNSSIDATPSDTSITPQTDYEYNIVMEGDVCYISIGQIPEVDLDNYVTQVELNTQINQLWQDCNDQFVDNDELAYVIDNLPLPDMSSYVDYDSLSNMSYVDYDSLNNMSYVSSSELDITLANASYVTQSSLDTMSYVDHTYLYSYVGDAISNIDVDIDLSSYGKTLSNVVDYWHHGSNTQAIVLNGPNGEISRTILKDNAAWKNQDGEWVTRMLYSGLLMRSDLIEFKQNTERITAIENSLPSYVDYESLNNMSYVDHAYLDSNYPSKTYFDSNYPSKTYLYSYYPSYTYLYSYVGDVIDNIPSPDLSSYVTYDFLSSQSYVDSQSTRHIEVVTQAEYDDISPDQDTLYYISDADFDVVTHSDLNSMSYVTSSDLDVALSTYATIDYVDDAISHIEPSIDLSSYVTYTYLDENYVSYNELNNYTEAISTALTYQRVDINNTYGYFRNYYTKTESDSRYVTSSQVAANYVDNDSLNNLAYGTSAALNELNDRVTYIEEQGSGGSVDLSAYVSYIDWDNTNEAIAQELTDNRLAHLDINSQFSYYYTKTDSDSRYATQSWANNKFVTQSDDVNRQQAIAAAFASTVQSTSVHNIWQGTQSDYNNISTPDPNTLYIIV